jgi:hypothetical protein
MHGPTGVPICTTFPCSCLSSTEQVENIRAKFGEAWPYGHGEGQQAIELLRIEGLPLPAYVVVLTDRTFRTSFMDDQGTCAGTAIVGISRGMKLLLIEGLPLPAYVVVLTEVLNIFDGRSSDTVVTDQFRFGRLSVLFTCLFYKYFI